MARRAAPFRDIADKPDFNGESFMSTLDTAKVVIEILCFEGAGGWGERTRLEPERPRVSDRLLEGAIRAPIIVRNDKATLSLYGPLENLEYMIEKFLRGVQDWATKSKCFKQITRPYIIRTIENSTSEASTAMKLRKALENVGHIDVIYVNSFENFSRLMEEPVLELRALSDFIASILKEDGEITGPGSGHARLPSNSAPSNTSLHLAKILNPEPAMQASTSGHVKTEDTASQRTAYEDLLEAAAYDTSSDKKSPSPEHEPEREPKSGLQYPASPSYSQPASVETLLRPFSAPWLKAEQPSSNSSSSILLQPTPQYHIRPSSAPLGTPQWKIDLSERKGHAIDILHVGPLEVEILTKCLTLVDTATRKGEECVRVIVDMKRLATEMEPEYKQWEEFCVDLERNVRIDEEEAREKTKREFGDAKVDDARIKSTNKSKGTGKGKGKDPSIYGTAAYGADADEEEEDDSFDTADPRDYGRCGPGDPPTAWGYRKVEAPATMAKAVRRRRRRPATYARDGEETDEEDEDDEEGGGGRGAPRDFGMGSESSTVRMGSPMSLVSQRSEGTEGVEFVTDFEEAVGGDDEGGEDQEMLDVGEGEGEGEGLQQRGVGEAKGPGNGNDGGEGDEAKGKKGLRSGGKVIGLYGEEL